jgi:hypothetical protein
MFLFLGNGLASYQEHHQRFMFIYMLFIISSLKLSKEILLKKNKHEIFY